MSPTLQLKCQIDDTVITLLGSDLNVLCIVTQRRVILLIKEEKLIT